MLLRVSPPIFVVIHSVKRHSLSVVVILFENIQFSSHFSLFFLFSLSLCNKYHPSNSMPWQRSCPDEDISFRLLLYLFSVFLSLFPWFCHFSLFSCHLIGCTFFLYHFSMPLCSCCCFRCYCYITQLLLVGLLVTERIFEIIAFRCYLFFISFLFPLGTVINFSSFLEILFPVKMKTKTHMKKSSER